TKLMMVLYTSSLPVRHSIKALKRFFHASDSFKAFSSARTVIQYCKNLSCHSGAFDKHHDSIKYNYLSLKTKQMNKLLFILLALPLLSFGQKQNVVHSSRYFPKSDKVLEFEKGLVAHIAKYHSGDWKWRVYEIQTGEDEGGYHVVEGSKTWDEFDKRGNLGEEHLKDWNKNVAPFLSDKHSATFSEYMEDLSTIPLNTFTDKISITHVYPKPGLSYMTEEVLKKLKKAWEAGTQSMAVYKTVASGPLQYVLVFRMKDGLKEFTDGYRKPFKERYETANGEGTSESYFAKINESTDHVWSEILFYRPDLSAK
ncbi:MAG: hypothetical protein M3139_07385, partial [Bacteroidota bacterium]|nr:hypothetical protein [Bacteroidota bacterium]